MKPTLNFFFGILVLFSSIAFSQTNIKLGKVSKEELSKKNSEKHPNAAAEVIYDIGKSQIQFSLATNNYVLITEIVSKIKIYNQKGHQYAKIEIPFFLNHRETVSFSRATTYNLVEGKIVRSRANLSHESVLAIDDQLRIKTLLMPDVKDGCIIEYRYTITSNNIDYIAPWVFEKDIPVQYSQFSTIYPESLIFNSFLSGKHKPKVVRNFSNEFLYNAFESEVVTQYSLANIAPFEPEEFLYNPEVFRTVLQHELRAFYTDSDFIKMSEKWEDVAKFLDESPLFGQQINNKNNFLEEDLAKILENKPDNLTKMTAVFNFVKQKMQWNNTFGIFTDKGIEPAYQASSGNIADINLLLLVMLKKVNLEAHPIIHSTRNQFANPAPNLNFFNYVMVGVSLNEKIYLLDASNKNSYVNLPPLEARGFGGRLILNNNETQKINLTPSETSSNTSIINYTIAPSGLIKGEFRARLTNYESVVLQDKILNNNQNPQKDKLETFYNRIIANNILFEPLQDNQQTVQLSFDFITAHYTEVQNNQIVLNPLLFYTNQNLIIETEIKNFPIQINYPKQASYVFKITLPEGYEVVNMPEDVRITTDDGVFAFNYLVSKQQNVLMISVKEDFNFYALGNERFAEFKKIYNTLLNSHQNQLILKKLTHEN